MDKEKMEKYLERMKNWDWISGFYCSIDEYEIAALHEECRGWNQNDKQKKYNGSFSE